MKLFELIFNLVKLLILKTKQILKNKTKKKTYKKMLQDKKETARLKYDDINYNYNKGNDKFYVSRLAGKEGLLDHEYNEKLPCICDEIIINDNIILFRENGRDGIIDSNTFEMLIKPKYYLVKCLYISCSGSGALDSQDLFVAYKGTWYEIGRRQDRIFGEMRLDNGSVFKLKNAGLLDRKGNTILDFKYTYIGGEKINNEVLRIRARDESVSPEVYDSFNYNLITHNLTKLNL